MGSICKMLPRNRYSIVKVICIAVLVIGCSLLLRTSTDSNITDDNPRDNSITNDKPSDIVPDTLDWREELQKHVPSYDNDTGISNVSSVNPHPFRLLISPWKLCDTERLLAFIYIHSKPDNFLTRAGIRRTWGNLTLFSRHIRIAFVLGTMPQRPGIQIALNAEARMYNDIIQEDFVDSYKNLTYKAIGALKWVTKFCAHAQYILKVDDDILVDTFTLIRVLRSMSKLSPSAQTGKLWCRVWVTMAVQRIGKWRVDLSEFSNDFYPRYCSGMAYMMTSDVAKALYMTSYSVPFFWVDDVYITGMLPIKMALRHTDAQYYFVLRPERLIQDKFTYNDGFNSPIFAHASGGTMLMEGLWHSVIELEEYLIQRGTPAIHKEHHSTTTPAGRHVTKVYTGKLVTGKLVPGSTPKPQSTIISRDDIAGKDYNTSR